MKSLKKLFVWVMTLTTVLAIFAISDALLAGVLSLIVSIWDKVFATKLFKIAFIILFALETLIIVPIGISAYKEEEK